MGIRLRSLRRQAAYSSIVELVDDVATPSPDVAKYICKILFTNLSQPYAMVEITGMDPDTSLWLSSNSWTTSCT